MLKDHLLKEDMQKSYLDYIEGRIANSESLYAWGTGRGAKKLLQLLKNIKWGG